MFDKGAAAVSQADLWRTAAPLPVWNFFRTLSQEPETGKNAVVVTAFADHYEH
jgi:hypothetical protein